MTEISDRDDQERKRTNPVAFFREVRQEARKITWATRQEVVQATLMVLILSVSAAIFFLIVDQVLGWGIRSIIQFFAG